MHESGETKALETEPQKPKWRAWLWGAAAFLLVLLMVMSSTRSFDAPPLTPDSPTGTNPGGRDPVAEFVEERMRPGSAAFAVPATVPLGTTVEARLETAPPSVSPAELLAELQALIQPPSIGRAGEAMLAPRMRAKLRCSLDCDIEPIEPEDRAIRFDERSTWRWHLTPKAAGQLRVLAVLSAPMKIDDAGPTEYPIDTFFAEVTVSVPIANRVDGGLKFLNDNWKLLGVLGAAVAAGWGWLRRKRRSTEGGPHTMD